MAAAEAVEADMAVAGGITVAVEVVVRAAADLRVEASVGTRCMNSRRFCCGSFSIQVVLPEPGHRPSRPVLMASNKVDTFPGEPHSGSPLPG